MKAKLFFFAALVSFFTFSTFPAFAETTSDPTENTVDKKMTEEEFKAAYHALKDRMDFLKEAKKNAKTKEERQKVQNEIRDVKEEAKQLKQQQSGGIYIGAGAIIVILILILLLR